MTELEMKTEAEVEDFTDELSDEALDRAEGATCVMSYSPPTCEVECQFASNRDPLFAPNRDPSGTA